jgi:hypothetical protein
MLHIVYILKEKPLLPGGGGVVRHIVVNGSNPMLNFHFFCRRMMYELINIQIHIFYEFNGLNI